MMLGDWLRDTMPLRLQERPEVSPPEFSTLGGVPPHSSKARSLALTLGSLQFSGLVLLSAPYLVLVDIPYKAKKPDEPSQVTCICKCTAMWYKITCLTVRYSVQYKCDTLPRKCQISRIFRATHDPPTNGVGLESKITSVPREMDDPILKLPGRALEVTRLIVRIDETESALG
jgi:hypothetical protein